MKFAGFQRPRVPRQAHNEEKPAKLNGQIGDYHNKWEFPKIRGTFFGGPYNKDYGILGSISGSPYLGKLPSKYAVLAGSVATPLKV